MARYRQGLGGCGHGQARAGRSRPRIDRARQRMDGARRRLAARGGGDRADGEGDQSPDMELVMEFSLHPPQCPPNHLFPSSAHNKN